MAYTSSVPADIGTSGLTLLASFVDISGTLHASLRNLACAEIGTSGIYRFSSASIDDGYRGQALFHTGAVAALSDFTTSNTYGAASINPQEVENSDVKSSTLSTYAGGAVASVTAGVTVTTNNDKTGYALTSGERDFIAAAELDLANGVYAGLTPRQLLRALAAALLGKSSNGGATYRNPGDTKNVITATIDGGNNRTGITSDLS